MAVINGLCGDFKTIFRNLQDCFLLRLILSGMVESPCLWKPQFYEDAWEHVIQHMPDARFSMQTNILGYDRKRWFNVLSNICAGRVSTSFDPDEKFRTYKGDTALYSRIFYDRLSKMLNDGFNPLVIGTYSEDTIHMADMMYDKSLDGGQDRCFDIRFNYRYPAGRDDGNGEQITPKSYGEALIDCITDGLKTSRHL